MQKLILTVLASAASAEDVFLGPKPTLDQDLINTSLDIDINVDKIVACQYFTESSVFSFSNILKPLEALNSDVTQQLDSFDFSAAGQYPTISANWNFCEKPFTSTLQGCATEGNAYIEYNKDATTTDC